jgi:hypothetical protein
LNVEHVRNLLNNLDVRVRVRANLVINVVRRDHESMVRSEHKERE